MCWGGGGGVLSSSEKGLEEERIWEAYRVGLAEVLKLYCVSESCGTRIKNAACQSHPPSQYGLIELGSLGPGIFIF